MVDNSGNIASRVKNYVIKVMADDKECIIKV
jgi:hypothetical protein